MVTIQPANQTTIQPSNQPTIQPINQPTNQPTNQPINQPTINQGDLHIVKSILTWLAKRGQNKSIYHPNVGQFS